MSLDECPEKVLMAKKHRAKKVTLHHALEWERVGKDKDGADLRKGKCRLCGYKVGIIRFCSRCGLRIDGQWKGEGGRCCICIKQDSREVVTE